jgi:hypothetical protein
MKGTVSWDYSVSGVLITSLLEKKVQLLFFNDSVNLQWTCTITFKHVP